MFCKSGDGRRLSSPIYAKDAICWQRRPVALPTSDWTMSGAECARLAPTSRLRLQPGMVFAVPGECTADNQSGRHERARPDQVPRACAGELVPSHASGSSPRKMVHRVVVTGTPRIQSLKPQKRCHRPDFRHLAHQVIRISILHHNICQ